MYTNLPANANISIFDFRTVFDLVNGKIKIDLSPSAIENPNGISGFKVKVTTPNNQITFPTAYIFTAANLNAVYQVTLPRIQGTYIWGVYQVEVIMTMAGVDYSLSKSFNLCAVETENPFANEKTGEILLKLDCRLGKIYGRGFSGYTYKNTGPKTERFDLTFYFPRETDLSPLRGLNQIPFELDAYVGESAVKGANTSTYEFPDNIFVTLKITASALKNARCDVDIPTVFCALRDQLKKIRECPTDAGSYTANAAEINSLLWVVFVGIDEGEDMSNEIDRLEELLQVNCSCQACAGRKIGPAQYIACPQVRNVQVTVTDDNTMLVTFNSAGVEGVLRVEYREYCDSATAGGFSLVDPDTELTQQNQAVTIPITEKRKYQVRLTTVKIDGTECAPVLMESDNDSDCPGGEDIIGGVDVGLTEDNDYPVTLAPGQTIVEIPANSLVDKIVIQDAVTSLTGFKIGTTSNGEEKWAATDYNTGSTVINPEIVTEGSPVILYFSGTNITTTITIFIRNL